MEDFFGGYFFWRNFLEVFFWEDFFGRIFWEDFFGRIFFGEDFFGGILWEEFFVYIGIDCQDFGFCQDFVSMEKEGRRKNLNP